MGILDQKKKKLKFRGLRIHAINQEHYTLKYYLLQFSKSQKLDGYTSNSNVKWTLIPLKNVKFTKNFITKKLTTCHDNKM